MDRSRVMGAVLVLALAGAAGAWFGGRPAPAPPVSVERPPPADGARPVMVHVAGEVALPGLVAVPDGARVADVIAAAGGLTLRADAAAVNLAAPVRDGEQITVPARGESPAGLAGGLTGDGLVRVNHATREQLETLPGVGPVLAGRILAHRDLHGPFETVEDLLDVPGIGEAKLAALRDAVVIP